jgi:hypothetical protein
MLGLYVGNNRILVILIYMIYKLIQNTKAPEPLALGRGVGER